MRVCIALANLYLLLCLVYFAQSSHDKMHEAHYRVITARKFDSFQMSTPLKSLAILHDVLFFRSLCLPIQENSYAAAGPIQNFYIQSKYLNTYLYFYEQIDFHSKEKHHVFAITV